MIDGKEDDHRTLKITVFIQQMAGRRIGENKISNMVLNDLYVHVSARDNYASKVQTESICKIISTNTTWIDWTSVSNFMVSAADYFFSYCFVMGLPAHAPLDTTPLGFIRGLRADGKWNEKAGLYGSKGDYVVYCDGHIT
jgi:hypothetical protein